MITKNIFRFKTKHLINSVRDDLKKSQSFKRAVQEQTQNYCSYPLFVERSSFRSKTGLKSVFLRARFDIRLVIGHESSVELFVNRVFVYMVVMVAFHVVIQIYVTWTKAIWMIKVIWKSAGWGTRLRRMMLRCFVSVNADRNRRKSGWIVVFIFDPMSRRAKRSAISIRNGSKDRTFGSGFELIFDGRSLWVKQAINLFQWNARPTDIFQIWSWRFLQRSWTSNSFFVAFVHFFRCLWPDLASFWNLIVCLLKRFR